jgi:hypothetical protein
LPILIRAREAARVSGEKSLVNNHLTTAHLLWLESDSGGRFAPSGGFSGGFPVPAVAADGSAPIKFGNILGIPAGA